MCFSQSSIERAVSKRCARFGHTIENQRDRTVPPLRIVVEKRNGRPGIRDPADRSRVNEAYFPPADILRPHIDHDVWHRDRDLRPMMDGQTLAARPRACSQQARFGYVCRNDEQVFKESFQHSIALVQLVKTRPGRDKTRPHGKGPERGRMTRDGHLLRINVTARCLL